MLDLGLMYALLSSDVHSPPILAAWVSTGESSLGRLTEKDNQTCEGDTMSILTNRVRYLHGYNPPRLGPGQN